MANSLALQDIELIAQETLEAMLPGLLALSAFSNNFNSVGAVKGQSIKVTQFVYPSTPSKDFTGAAGGLYTDSDDITENEILVPLDKHLFKSHTLTQDELQNGIKIQNIQYQAQRVMQDMLDYILGKIVAASYANKTDPIAASAFDSDEVSKIRDAVQKLHWGKNGRSMILNTDYYGALTRDPSVKHVFNSGSNAALNEGELPRLSGFDVIEYTDLQNNSEALEGFAVQENGLAIATGAIIPAETAQMIMQHATATDEATGFTVSVRRGTDFATGKETFVTEVLAGAVKGDEKGIYRIVSA